MSIECKHISIFIVTTVRTPCLQGQRRGRKLHALFPHEETIPRVRDLPSCEFEMGKTGNALLWTIL